MLLKDWKSISKTSFSSSQNKQWLVSTIKILPPCSKTSTKIWNTQKPNFTSTRFASTITTIELQKTFWSSISMDKTSRSTRSKSTLQSISKSANGIAIISFVSKTRRSRWSTKKKTKHLFPRSQSNIELSSLHSTKALVVIDEGLISLSELVIYSWFYDCDLFQTFYRVYSWIDTISNLSLRSDLNFVHFVV